MLATLPHRFDSAETSDLHQFDSSDAITAFKFALGDYLIRQALFDPQASAIHRFETWSGVVDRAAMTLIEWVGRLDEAAVQSNAKLESFAGGCAKDLVATIFTFGQTDAYGLLDVYPDGAADTNDYWAQLDAARDLARTSLTQWIITAILCFHRTGQWALWLPPL